MEGLLHGRDNAGQKKLGTKYYKTAERNFGFWKMDLATLKTGLNGEGVREEDLSESPTLDRGKWTLTWI